MQRLLSAHQAGHKADRIDEWHEALLRVDELNGRDHEQLHAERTHHLVEHARRGVSVGHHASEGQPSSLQHLDRLHRLREVAGSAAAKSDDESARLSHDAAHDGKRVRRRERRANRALCGGSNGSLEALADREI